MTEKVQDNLVVTLDYTLIVEDEILESTSDGEAIEFIQGFGQIIPGLENALYDMKIGEGKTVVIEPEEAYGIYDEDSTEIAKKEEIKVASGSYETYLVEPELRDLGGVFKKSKNATLKIWVTADRRCIPVKIKSKVKVGSFVAELVSVENGITEIPFRRRR